MSTDHVFSTIIGRLLTLYGEPKTENVEGYLTEYAERLKGYSDTELEAAADDLIGRQMFRSWPTIAECVKACDAARIAMASAQGIQTADVKGTGWRVSSSGRRWFRIERGNREFESWMQFYRNNGRQMFAKFSEHCGYSFTLGPSPIEHGGAMLAYMDRNKPKSMEAAE